MSRHKKNQVSQRQRRVSEAIRHILAEKMLRGGFFDETLESNSISVSEVRVSPDLRHAKIYVMPLQGHKQDEIVEALNEFAPKLRHFLGQNLKTKYTPELYFVADESFSNAAHMEELLSRLRYAPQEN